MTPQPSFVGSTLRSLVRLVVGGFHRCDNRGTRERSVVRSLRLVSGGVVFETLAAQGNTKGVLG